jgi:deoxyribonuclease I
VSLGELKFKKVRSRNGEFLGTSRGPTVKTHTFDVAAKSIFSRIVFLLRPVFLGRFACKGSLPQVTKPSSRGDFMKLVGRQLQAFFALVLFVPAFAHALTLSNENIPYYGETFYKEVSKGMRDDDLIAELRTVLVSKHQKGANGMDQVVDHCDSAAKGCYEQRSIGYKAARTVLLGNLHLVKVQGKQFGIKEVYCQETMTGDQFPDGDKPAPNVCPSDKYINIEHTWPQSRFSKKYDAGIQKSDLHHLFPTDSKLNSIRGNFKFAVVDKPEKALRCGLSKFGQAKDQNGHFFEPPDAHKGNVARALFYFSVRYDIKIDPKEEAFLKAWNKADPADQEERERNEEIFKIQGNRNPFVDFPELADVVSDF